MEPALKTRLLGAAVLIALAVIFIPMLFSGSKEKSGSQSVSLNIPPAPDQELQTRTLAVGPNGAAAGTSTAAAITDPDHVATLDLGKQGTNATSQDLAGAAANAPAPSSSSPQQVVATNTKPKQGIESGQLPGGPGAAARTGYFLNLGIYADHANARKLITDLRKHYFVAHATSEPLDGKPALRVRIGPFSDRAEAEAARLKVKAAEPGVPVVLESNVANQTADAAPSALPANKPGGWAVQLGAFNDRGQANKMRDRLRELGFDGYVDGVKSGKGTLWRVRAGPVTARDAAETLRSQIEQRMKIKGIIVTEH